MRTLKSIAGGFAGLLTLMSLQSFAPAKGFLNPSSANLLKQFSPNTSTGVSAQYFSLSLADLTISANKSYAFILPQKFSFQDSHNIAFFSVMLKSGQELILANGYQEYVGWFDIAWSEGADISKKEGVAFEQEDDWSAVIMTSDFAQSLASAKVYLEVEEDIDIRTVELNGFYSYEGGIELMDGESHTISVNVDDAPTIDEIISSISSYDYFGAECEVTITESEREKYDPTKIGTYSVVINAEDSYGQTASATLVIEVLDIVKPTIKLKSGSTLSFVPGDTLSESSLRTYFEVTDNALDNGGTVGSLTFKLDSVSLTSSVTLTNSDIGSHTLSTRVSDSSGNTAEEDFTLVVRDTLGPVVSLKEGSGNQITLGVTEFVQTSDAEFLSFFKAQDETDGNVSGTLRLETEIPKKVGDYSVNVLANDTSGNVGSFGVVVHILEDFPPVFLLTDAIIASADNPLTSDQIKSIVMRALENQGESLAEVYVNADGYLSTPSLPGTYELEYRAVRTDGTSFEGSINIKVMERTYEEENWWQMAWESITLFFNRLWNFLTGKGWTVTE